MKTSLVGTILRTGQKALASEKGRQWAWLTIGLLLSSFLSWVLSKTAPSAIEPGYLALQLKMLFAAAIMAALFIAFPRLRSVLHDFWARMAQQSASLETSQRLYLRVAQLTLGLLFLFWINPGPALAPLIVLLGAFCTFVALYDAQRLYTFLAQNTWGKGALAVGLAAASALAYAVARQEIAAVTHVVPTNFQHTTILVSIMTIPFLAVLAGSSLFAISMAVYSVFIPLQMLAHKSAPGLLDWLFAGTLKKRTMKFPLVTRLVQFFFYAVFGVLVAHFGRPVMAKYEAVIQQIARPAIYHYDMYEGRECPLVEGEKLAALGDSKFLVGRRDMAGNIEFTGPIKCDELPTRPAIP